MEQNLITKHDFKISKLDAEHIIRAFDFENTLNNKHYTFESNYWRDFHDAIDVEDDSKRDITLSINYNDLMSVYTALKTITHRANQYDDQQKVDTDLLSRINDTTELFTNYYQDFRTKLKLHNY